MSIARLLLTAVPCAWKTLLKKDKSHKTITEQIMQTEDFENRI